MRAHQDTGTSGLPSGVKGTFLDEQENGKRLVNSYVAKRIKELRISRGLSSHEVARRAGIALGSYNCLENDRYNINLDNLFRILQVHDAKPQEVWPRTQEKAPAGGVDTDYVRKVVTTSRRRDLRRQVSLDDILSAVLQVFDKVKEDDLCNPEKRFGRISLARAAAGILVKRSHCVTLSALCRRLGITIGSGSRLIARHEKKLEQTGHLRRPLERMVEILRRDYPDFSI
ncbi:MAG TPA: helix-turn-helix transcriptional regulator [Acidobacteriota bacterium]|nr:helix-turn-helix transcriptional regulator [Acidobacteriota bacterium]